MTNDWREGGLNYLGQRVDSRIISTEMYDTEEERNDAIKKSMKNGIHAWGLSEKKVDDKIKYVLELEETRLVDLPDGYVLDMPWKEMAYDHDDVIDRIKYDPEVDKHIEEILILFNELGIETWSSCSGLLEDHLGIFPYDEMCRPFILFDDIKDIEKILNIVVDTDWIVEARSWRYPDSKKVFYDFSISSEIDGDARVIKLWDDLKNKLEEYKNG